MLAGSLRSRRIIRQVLRQLGYDSPAIFKWIKKTRLFPGYRQRVALYAAYRQRVGDVSSVAAAKISVSARHAERAWLEPWCRGLLFASNYRFAAAILYTILKFD